MDNDLAELRVDTVIVTESIRLETHTMTSLTERIRSAWRDKTRGRPVRVSYARGENLLIERSVLRSVAEDPMVSGLQQPFQVVRQQTETALLHPEQSPLEMICIAAQALHEKGSPAKSIVCRSSRALHEWVGVALELERVFNIRIYEDANVPSSVRCFVCGSSESDMLGDIDNSVAILREK